MTLDASTSTRLLRHLAALECNEVLVEAGPRLAGSFLAAGLVDEIVLYVAPTILGDAAPALALPCRSRCVRWRSDRSIPITTCDGSDRTSA